MSWTLTAIFLLSTFPCVHRLVCLDYTRLGQAVRHGDLVELMLALAMVAMLCPLGGPIPAAGWQAVLGVTALWFLTAWWREWRAKATSRHHNAHHAVTSMAMLYMVSAMPHGGPGGSPWLNMSTMDTSAGLALPAVAVLAATYFAYDAARSGWDAIRPPEAAGFTSRAVCRSIMGLGMGYLLLVAL